MLVLT
ncbi:hypothetical protein VCHENC02_4604, partial [Vibrio harveyi]